jgi:predicted transcriptional regulator
MQEEFIACGLTPTEYKVLIHILSKGKRSAGAISQSLKIKRTTVYSALQSLIKRKLIRKTEKKGIAEFSAATPDEIPMILEQQAKEKMERILSSIELIKPRIQGFKSGHVYETGGLEINHYDNTADFLNLLRQHIFEKDFCAVWNPQIAITSPRVKERIRIFLEETGKKRLRIKDILADGPMARWYINNIKNDRHEVKLIKGEDKSMADIIVTDELIIIELNSPDSESALEIKSKHLSLFMKWFFMSLWERLPELK